MKKSVCLQVLKNQGQKSLALTRRLHLINAELKIQSDNKHIYIPLARQPSKPTLKTLQRRLKDYRICVRSFSKKEKKAGSLSSSLKREVPSDLLSSVPKAYDVIGDVAILQIPLQHEKYESAIGEAVLKFNPMVHTVLSKAGAIQGRYRLRKFKVLAGERKTETVHKEYGCLYHLDVARVFFSPRLSFEHHRIASLVCEDEVVVDLFAGVGSFSIQIAKTHPEATVYAVDANSCAIDYLKKNISVNRLAGRVKPVHGDAKKVFKGKSGFADRVIMNLPEKSFNYVDVACKIIKPSGGIIHFYTFVSKTESLENRKARLFRAVTRSGRNVKKVISSRLVRETAPYEKQACIDIEIC
jgi:tRNA (guanine37-N1)-methyltransferase